MTSDCKIFTLLGFRSENPKRILLLILLLAFAIRLAHLFLWPTLDRDAVLYLNFAEIWHTSNYEAVQAYHNHTLGGDTEYFSIPVLYIYLVQLGIPFFGDIRISGLAVSLASGILLIIAVYGIADVLFRNPKVSLLAATLIAVQPSCVTLSCSVLRDSLALCLMACSCWFSLYGALRKNIASADNYTCFGFCVSLNTTSRFSCRKNNIACIAAGIAGGAAFLTRYENLELVVLYLLLFAGCIISDRQNWRFFIKAIAIVFLSLGISIVLLLLVMNAWENAMGMYLRLCDSYSKWIWPE